MLNRIAEGEKNFFFTLFTVDTDELLLEFYFGCSQKVSVFLEFVFDTLGRFLPDLQSFPDLWVSCADFLLREVSEVREGVMVARLKLFG